MREDGGDFIFEFLSKCIRLNIDKSKLGFIYNEELRKTTSSSSFSLGVFDLLLELVKPISEKDSLWSKINFDS